MNTSPDAFQQAFASTLLTPQAPVCASLQALTSQPGFAVYRNTVMKACVDALEANFPAVARLVGPEWFRAAGTCYVAAAPPRDARLLRYGDGFALFLRDFPPAAELSYLPGVAQLDSFWRESHGALDAPIADALAVARLGPADMALLALTPHPAARWAWFDDAPIFSIWDSNRRRVDVPEDLCWASEGALLTRPHDTVTWHPLTRGACLFLEACAEGLTLAQAADRVLEAHPEADMATVFALLLRAGALSALPTSPPGLCTP